MEAAGLGIGVVGLVGQLLSASFKGYEFLGRVQTIGGDLGRFQWRLQDERLRLKRWEEAWGRVEKTDGGEVEGHVIVTLTRLVDTFRDVEALSGRYSLVQEPGEQKKGGTFRRLLFRNRRSSSPVPGGDKKKKKKPSVYAIADVSVLASTAVKDAAALHEGLRKLQESTLEVETQLSSVMMLRWAIADQAKADQLVMDLGMYNEALERYVTPLGPVIEKPAPEEPSAPRIFSVPLEPNESFTGRESLLKKLDSYLTRDTGYPNRVGVHGMGGIGKTQLVAQYAHTYRTTYSSIFWIRASRISTAKSSFAHISKLAGLTPDITGEHEAAAIQAAKEWLESPQSGRWLLIFDNGDDASSSSPSSRDDDGNSLFKVLANMMPVRGNTIITTRDRRVLGSKIAKLPLEVGVMDITEAVGLFKEKAYGADYYESPSETTSMQSLVTSLGFLPLAIDQAASYVRHLGIPVDELQDQLEGEETTWLADERSAELDSYSSSVMRTWEVSLAHIDATFPAAGKLFRLLGFLDNEYIHENWLFDGFREGAGDGASGTSQPREPSAVLRSLLGDELSDRGEYTRALGALNSLSLLRLQKSQTPGNTDADTIWIHRLVHTWVRERMSATEKSVWMVAGIELVGYSHPSQIDFTYHLLLQNWNLFTGEESVLTTRTVNTMLEVGKATLPAEGRHLGKLDFFIGRTGSRGVRIAGLCALVMVKLNTLNWKRERLPDWNKAVEEVQQSAYAIPWKSLDGATGISADLITDVVNLFTGIDDDTYYSLPHDLWWHFLHSLRASISGGTSSPNLLRLSASFHLSFAKLLHTSDATASTQRSAAYLSHHALRTYLSLGYTPESSEAHECISLLLHSLEFSHDFPRLERALRNDFPLSHSEFWHTSFQTQRGLQLFRKLMTHTPHPCTPPARLPEYISLLASHCIPPSTDPPSMNPTSLKLSQHKALRNRQFGNEAAHTSAEHRRKRRLELFRLLREQGRYDTAARLFANTIESCDYTTGVRACSGQKCTGSLMSMEAWRADVHAFLDCLERERLAAPEEIAACRFELKMRMDGRSVGWYKPSGQWWYRDESTGEEFQFAWAGDEGIKLRTEVLAVVENALEALKSDEVKQRLTEELVELSEWKFKVPDEMKIPLEDDVVFWEGIEKALFEGDGALTVPVLDEARLVEIEERLKNVSERLTEDLEADERELEEQRRQRQSAGSDNGDSSGDESNP